MDLGSGIGWTKSVATLSKGTSIICKSTSGLEKCVWGELT